MPLSLVICTHNPRPEYFSRCLAALERQSLAKDRWELVIVDNASDAQTAPPRSIPWHPRTRVVEEPRLGLTPARLTGIRSAAGELLVFVDDDNILDTDFLEVALRVADERPFLGSWSGQSRPEFEAPPPEWTRRYWGNLVIRNFDRDVWSNLPRLPETMPCGAGLCVRRSVAKHYLWLHDTGKRAFQSDRTGTSLLSGGDNDLAACACDIGLGVGLVSALKLTHIIPPVRLTQDYLTRLAEGIYFSAVVIAHLRASRSELSSYVVRKRDVLRALVNRTPHRQIQLANLRGRRLGLEFVAALESAQIVSSNEP